MSSLSAKFPEMAETGCHVHASCGSCGMITSRPCAAGDNSVLSGWSDMEDNRVAKQSTETSTQDRLNGALQEFTYTWTAMVAFFLLSQNSSGVSPKPFKHVECISVLTFATVFVIFSLFLSMVGLNRFFPAFFLANCYLVLLLGWLRGNCF